MIREANISDLDKMLVSFMSNENDVIAAMENAIWEYYKNICEFEPEMGAW